VDRASAKRAGVRDLVVREALQAMSRDAAKRLRELVAAGQQIPYDVQEPGSGSPLPQYVPLTELFIRDRAPALLELDSFGSGCAAIESAGLAGPYLEELGIAVPSDGRQRGELAGVAFLCRLWEGSTDFSLDARRLSTAIEEIEAGGEAGDDEIEVVVPLRGLQLPVVRLELATATIVRADTVEVPAEARAPEGGGAAGWEPTFLAAARVSADESREDDAEPRPDAGARAVEAFRHLITALRLFKAGGVGLGPYAWTRAGTHRWRRIATGAGRPRPGGYRLAEDELNDLVVFSRALAYRSTPFGRPATDARGTSRALARSINRFEAGLERNVALEALNDYLLALRFLLEGGGPARLGLSMRVAALCAEPEERGVTKAIVDRALGLERELWSGEPPPAAEDAPAPAATATAIEDLVRAILKDAACGHLGADMRATADEILLADGLAVGEGVAEHRGGREEWDMPDLSEAETREEAVLEWGLEPDAPRAHATEPATEAGPHGPGVQVDEPGREDDREPAVEGGRAVQEGLWIDVPDDWQEVPAHHERGTGLQVPEPGGRIRIESRPHPEEDNVLTQNPIVREERPIPDYEPAAPGERHGSELLEARPRGRQSTADRVAYLFPRPETTEWDVRELSYDRRRRARV
jgi:hypothetical protein